MTKEKAKQEAGNNEEHGMQKKYKIFLVFFTDGTMAINRIGRLDDFNKALVQQAFIVPEETPLYEISGFFARAMQEIPAKWKQVK